MDSIQQKHQQQLTNKQRLQQAQQQQHKVQMNDYWHIPRASLVSSSAASSASSSNRSHKSNSNPPTVTKRAGNHHGNNNTMMIMQNGRHGAGMAAVHGGKKQQQPRRNSELSATSAAATAAAAAAVLAAAAAPKRGSRSSQGSSDSNHSTRSAASGSLLLTAANLERFAEIHRRQDQQQKLYLQSSLPQNANQLHSLTAAAAAITTIDGAATTANAVYNANLMQSLMPQNKANTTTNADDTKTHNNNDAIITMDPNLHFIKTKDLDSISLASSMHFTMVNGDDGPAKRKKRGLCDRGRQVTVLIVSMSTIFLLLIMGMVYALEMRAREMPQS